MDFFTKNLCSSKHYFIFSHDLEEAIELYKVHLGKIKDVIIDFGLERKGGMKLFNAIKNAK